MSDAGLLQSQRVLITGAASGIGRAGLSVLAREGAVVAGIDTNEVELDAAVRETSERVGGGPIMGLKADVRDEDSLEEAVRTVRKQIGGIDALWVNAALPPRIAPIEEWPSADARELVLVNVFGAWLTVQVALPVLRATAKSPPRILFTSSVSGRKGRPNLTAYQMCKGAIEQLVRALAVEVGPEGIRVNAVAPGSVDTPLFRSMLATSAGARYYDELLSSIPLGRLTTPEEVGRIAAFLLSPRSEPVTGVSVAVDGGALA